jgi:hypothetical protein
MKRISLDFELITPCFCGGAEPEHRAEIRCASIRGQLRWWFRVLGGFKSLSPLSVREQECRIFGSAAGDTGLSGALRLQLAQPLGSNTRKNAEDFNAGVPTDLGYGMFPLRPQGNGRDGKRGVISEGSEFSLAVIWRGDVKVWPEILSLLSVWSHLGALGFRSRRALGALRLKSGLNPLGESLQSFGKPTGIRCFQIEGGNGWRLTSGALLKWYRGWRQHGRSIDLRPGNLHGQPPENSGFRFAKRDHDIGYDLPAVANLPAFRPALGLPIIQRTRGGTKNWDWGGGRAQPGRFASPVILRPHKDGQGVWRGVIIFVDALQWPAGKEVYVSGQRRAVSLELYDAMKHDSDLRPFP